MYFSILSTKLRVCLNCKSNLLNTRHRLLCYLPVVWVLTRVGQGEEACFKDGLWLFSNRSDTTTIYQLMMVPFSWFSAETVSNNCTTFSGNFDQFHLEPELSIKNFRKSDLKASLLACQSHPSLAIFSCFCEKQVQVYLEPLTLCRMWKTSKLGGEKGRLGWSLGSGKDGVHWDCSTRQSIEKHESGQRILNRTNSLLSEKMEW